MQENDLVTEANCGISIEPENSDAIVEAINLFQLKNLRELDEMGKRGKEFVLKNHEYSVLAEKFIKIISK